VIILRIEGISMKFTPQNHKVEVLVLQRDFTFLIEPDVAYDATDKPLHGDAGNN
jgi:hypothetical protein